MNLHQLNKPSVYLVILAITSFCFGAAMVYIVRATEDSLHYDAGIINGTGMIRGSVQRIAKLVLFDVSADVSGEIETIDKMLVKFSTLDKKVFYNTPHDDYFARIHELDRAWEAMKSRIDDYLRSPMDKQQRALMDASEVAWHASIAAVLAAQVASEEKVSRIKYLFNLFLVSAVLSAVFTLLVLSIYLRRKLEHESSHDPLTNLLNRRAYTDLAEYEVKRSSRYDTEFALILLDIDHFKRINDTFGHKMGDEVLIKLARILSSTVRKTDSVFRIGGEEFVVLCPHTNAEGAYRLADMLRRTVENAAIIPAGKLTISLGVAQLSEDMTEAKLLSNADKALYQAKDQGRNQTRVFMEEKATKN